MRHSETHSCSLVASTVVGYGGFSEHAKLAASSCRRIVASEGLGAHMPTQIIRARRPTTLLPAHGAQPFSRRVGWPSNPQSIRAHAVANRPERLRALIQWQRGGPLFQFCRGPAGNRGHDCRGPGDELSGAFFSAQEGSLALQLSWPRGAQFGVGASRPRTKTTAHCSGPAGRRMGGSRLSCPGDPATVYIPPPLGVAGRSKQPWPIQEQFGEAVLRSMER